jgi:hypothetical protein
MSPKTTPNADRPSADRLAAFAGRAMVSPTTSDKRPIPAIVEVLHPGLNKKHTVGMQESREGRSLYADYDFPFLNVS